MGEIKRENGYAFIFVIRGQKKGAGGTRGTRLEKRVRGMMANERYYFTRQNKKNTNLTFIMERAERKKLTHWMLFRCLSHPLFRDANPRGCTPLFNRAGYRSTNATGCPRRMEYDTSVARRYRNSILHRHLLRSALLQCHHYLVLLLPIQFARGEFSLISKTIRVSTLTIPFFTLYFVDRKIVRIISIDEISWRNDTD